MTTAEITKGNGSTTPRSGDVFHAMREEMDRVFDRFELGWPRWPRLLQRDLGRDIVMPEMDVHENGNQLTVEMDLPGVDEKDVTVTLNNGMLTIKGVKKSEREEKKEDYHVAERSCGSFERSLRLPESIDENRIDAKFDRGVLKIIAQKRPEAVKPERRIPIAKA